MTLRLEIGRVGRLASLAGQSGSSPEAARRAAREVELAAAAVAGRGHERHVEPTTPLLGLAPDAPAGALGRRLEYPLWHTTALHYLRRVGAHLWAEGRVPSPGNPEALEDPLYEEYYDAHEDSALGEFWTRARESQGLELDFPHLCIHADDTGWYLPVSFPEPVWVESIGAEKGREAGAWVGSCSELIEECEELAAALELDVERDPYDAEVLEAARRSEQVAAESARRGAPPSSERPERWLRYGIEAHTCLTILRAARTALETGSALCLVDDQPERDPGGGGSGPERPERGGRPERDRRPDRSGRSGRSGRGERDGRGGQRGQQGRGRR